MHVHEYFVLTDETSFHFPAQLGIQIDDFSWYHSLLRRLIFAPFFRVLPYVLLLESRSLRHYGRWPLILITLLSLHGTSNAIYRLFYFLLDYFSFYIPAYLS
ncbi:hypothetical protein GGR58DRAFT_472282 [Xylaria digitata]|nr:hypothetical protein GGR58DRAFT_472282 [Xylaria digitata]